MAASKHNVAAVSNVSILNVLGVDLCARAILDYVPFRDLMRSERVSRHWQSVVHNYLQIPTLTLTLYDVRNCRPTEDEDHRIIEFPRQMYSLPLLSRIIEEWWTPIVKVITDRYDEDYIEIISSKCLNVQHVVFTKINKQTSATLIRALTQIQKCENLKKISLKFLYDVSGSIGEFITKVNCEKIEMDIWVPRSYQVVLSGNYHKYQSLYELLVRTGESVLTECSRPN